MKDELETVDWATEMRSKTAGEIWSILVHKHVPTRTVRGRGRPAWLTKEIIAAV
jgi:hypothetical protein